MINKIKITDNFYFTADSNQYILIRCGEREKINIKTKKPTGEMVKYEEGMGYFSSIESLIRGCRKIIVKEKVLNGDLTTIDNILDYMNTINDELEKLLSKVKDY